MTTTIDPPATAAADEHHPAETGATEAESPAPHQADPHLSPTTRNLLLATLGVDAILVFVLAVKDFTLTASSSAIFGAVLYLALGLTCAWAYFAQLFSCPTKLVATVLSQVGVALLAGYILVLDSSTPTMQWLGVSGIATVLGVVALFWVVRLGRYTKSGLTKCSAALVALLPLLGVYQYWMQTDYLPHASEPLVDVTADLTPIGTKDGLIHLRATVTLENKGSVDAVAAGGLMRVTSYNTGRFDPDPTPEKVAAGLDMTGEVYGADFRAQATEAAKPKLVFADDFLIRGTHLVPHGKVEYKRVVTVDENSVRLVRLTVDAGFLTDRRLNDMTACGNSQLPSADGHQPVAPGTLESHGGLKLICTENQIVARDVLQQLLADTPAVQVTIVVADPNPRVAQLEYPKLFINFTSKDVRGASERVSEMVPNLVIRNLVAEYSPGDSAPSGSAVVNASHPAP